MIFIPVSSALIGWFTNWVALKMLFYPRHPRKMAGITFQGIFPKHQSDVAQKIGTMIASELLTSGDVIAHLKSQEQLQTIKTVAERRVDDYLNTTFRLKHPLLATLLSDKRRQELKDEVMETIEFFTPEIIDHITMKLEKDFDVAQIISDRIAALNPAELEKMLLRILGKEFAFVEYIGGFIGFLIGLLQVGIAVVG